MRTTIGILGFFAVGAGAVGVGAIGLSGSDTIKDVTIEVLSRTTGGLDCGGTAQAAGNDLSYIGTGSSNGQAAVVSTTSGQFVAPMSRFFNTGVCNTTALATRAQKAEGIVFALDGISLVAGNTDPAFVACGGTATCGTQSPVAGIRNSGTIPGTSYTVSPFPVGSTGTEWKDALRLLYFGMKVTNGNNILQRDCNSAERNALANNWNALFQSCSQTNCTTIKHAYRRNDESGTTDTFVSALGVSSINLAHANSPFCNVGTQGITASQTTLPDTAVYLAQFGNLDTTTSPVTPGQIAPGKNINGARGQYFPDMQDLDPIRRACTFTSSGTIEDDVCEAERGNVGGRVVGLGLVLSIYEAPENTAAQSVVAFPSTPCTAGAFTCVNATPLAGLSGQFELCPSGSDPNTAAVPLRGHGRSKVCSPGTCAVPVIKVAGQPLDPRCINSRANLEPQDFGTYDGRVHNLFSWALDPATNSILPAKVLRNGAQVNMAGAFYRIHGVRPDVAGGTTCQFGASATDQIGCLVKAEKCSVGYAGNSAVSGTTFALNVNNVAPTDACVQNLVNLTPTDPATYPLSRKLYLNSLDGFENLNASSPTQFKMAKCFGGTTAASIATEPAPPLGHGGFVSLPGQPFCEDFDETQSGCTSTGTPNTDACLSNPAGIPSH